MKFKQILFGTFLLALLSACAPRLTPQLVGLKYWQKMTRLDPAAAALVDRKHQAQAKSKVKSDRVNIKNDHPDLDDYRFDFSQVNAMVTKQDPTQATVKVQGRALVYDPDGTLLDEDIIDETLHLRKEFGYWRVDYDHRPTPGSK